MLGGAQVDVIGVRGAVLACAVGIALAPAWIILSPLPKLRSLAEAKQALDPAPAVVAVLPSPEARAA